MTDHGEEAQPKASGQEGGAPLPVVPLAVARPRARFGIWLILSLPLVALAAVFAFLVLSHQPLGAPDWLLGRIEARANAALGGRMTVRLGGADVIVDEGFVPRVRLREVQLAQPSGMPLAVFPELRATFRAEPLLRGKLEPRSFRIRGASVALRRLADGRFDLDLGAGLGRGGLSGFGLENLGALTDAVEATFAAPILAKVEQITAEDLRIRLDDGRLGKVWQVSDGRFRLSQTAEKIALTLAFDVGERDRLPAQVALSATTTKHSPEAEFGAAVTDVPAADLASQSPALAMLGLLDAPISGTLRSGVDAAGNLHRLEASLRIGQGALRPDAGAKPVAFERADLRLHYDPARQQVTITDLGLQSRALRFAASGQVLLRDFANGLPREALVQMALSDIQADPEGLFERPARFSAGAVDARLRLDPFRAELGQVQLVEGERRIAGRGAVSAGADGWRVAFDAGIDHITQADLLALWPPALVPPTRMWLAENVATGELRKARAALRLTPGTAPRIELGYEFRGAEVTILRTLPPVTEGRGFAGITENQHTLMVEEGTVQAPSGGRIEVADSVMTVPDIKEKFAHAVVHLVTRAPIPAALSLLDQEPFRFLSKAGQGTDIATGWAEARTTLRFRLLPKITPEDVDFSVAARLTDVHSEKVVPGRVLSAPRLSLRADRAGMSIAGRGQFDTIPFDARWRQKFDPKEKGHSTVDGFVELTPAALDHLGIGLPKGAVSGEGWGHMAIDLRKNQPPAYDFETDLKGIALEIPEIGWRKPAAPKGHFTIRGALGAVATVEHMALNAPGLSAEGALTLSAKGFERASLSKVTVGTWFSGALDLIGRGKGRAPDVAVTSGKLDLRAAKFGAGAKGGEAGGNRITASLERLTVTDTLALAPLRGEFTSRGGFSGRFTGRVNGAAEVAGAVIPAQGGRAAVRITSENAGEVLRASGLFTKARGGALDLTLTPVDQASYDGTLKASGLRVKNAPALASLLSAASVIGLLEQLNGDGILFHEVSGAFRLTPKGVSVTSGEALGASMGVTMTGNYFPATGQMEMEGVITPFYLVNSIGQVFARPGEGLFGFTYALGGTANALKVSINPLSILTPGMFREIFRHAPPKLVTE